eukprot:NODE_716_length_4503_cov_0.446639.p1 type:complete len:811 gc:universal NODE_716_length_4503_cov_0.446639:1990-4422(+)
MLIFDNLNLDPQIRFEACNNIGNDLVRMLNIAANNNFGKTRKRYGIKCSSLTDVTTNRLLGNNDIANKIIEKARKLAMKKYKKDMDKLPTGHYQKIIKIAARRKGISRQYLDRLKIVDHLEQWQPKWALEDDVHDAFIPNSLPNVDWNDCSMEDFLQILMKTPKSKSTGDDGVKNELLHESSDRFKSLLCKYMNLIGKHGMVPDLMRYSLIVPVHKGRTSNYESILEYRPIGLVSTLRKLFELMWKPRLLDFLHTKENQHGFKTAASTLDAAWYLQNRLMEMGYNPDEHLLVKGDVTAAFDSIEYEPMMELFEGLNMPDNYKSLIINLCTRQNIQLLIGDIKSQSRGCGRGLLQGTTISPNIFTKLVDMVMDGMDILSVWFADDIIYAIKKTEYNQVLLDIQSRLSRIGLTFNESKTYPLTHDFEYWLGFTVNCHGINGNQQATRNLQKAKNKLRNARNLGIFKNAAKSSHLLRYIGSSLLPVLDYGLGLHDPIPEIAMKFDVFINSAVRTLLGIPFPTPIADIREYCGYSSYLERWHCLQAKFKNRVAVKQNQLKSIEFAPKPRFSFTMDKQLSKQAVKHPFLNQIFTQKYPNRTMDCSKCNGTHKFVNKLFQCHSFQFNNELDSICNLHEGETVIQIPPDWTATIQSYQNQMICDEIHVYSDASVHKSPFNNATSAFIVISKANYAFKVHKLSHLQIADSTRAEICGLANSIIHLNQHFDTQNPRITFFCDNKAANSSFIDAMNGSKPLYNIYSIDIISQVLNMLQPSMQFKYVKGHDHSNPQNINHLVDYLTHYHSQADISILKLNY